MWSLNKEEFHIDLWDRKEKKKRVETVQDVKKSSRERGKCNLNSKTMRIIGKEGRKINFNEADKRTT